MTGAQLPSPPPERMATMWSAMARRARETNLIRVGEIGAALELAASDQLDGAGWATAEQTAHQLAGSAGTFGYATASDVARTLEQLLGRAGAAGRASTEPAELDRARLLLDQLVDQLARDPDLD